MKATAFISCIFALVLVSCSTSTSSNVKSIHSTESEHWTRGELKESVVTSAESKDTTVVHITYAFANEDSPLKSLTDSLIQSYLDFPSKNGVNLAYYEGYAKQFLNEFDEYANDPISFRHPWYLNVSIDFCPVDSHFVRAEFQEENYLGGAHGSVNFTTFMIDASTQKIAQLNDLFTNVNELEKRVEATFRKTYELEGKDLSEEGFWFENGIFKMNNNFYFDENHFVMTFNQYEIGPYAMGIFSIEIPLEELKDIKKF